MAKPNKSEQSEISWAQAFRDIIIKSMDKGQLLPVLGFLIMLALIFKMPEDKVYTFGEQIVAGFKDMSLLGWLCATVACVLWSGHARIMRRKHSAEYRRIGLEKSRLQQAKIKGPIGSSDSK